MVFAKLLKPKPRLTKAQTEVTMKKAASCEAKVSFVNPGEAEKQITWMRRVRRIRARLHPYKCEFCHKYHIGSTEEQPKHETVRHRIPVLEE